jgi:hypothetical protein
MTIEIMINVPDTLEKELQRFRDRLPEALERGLRELSAETQAQPLDENEIVALLASQPSPDRVLAIRPSPELQTRVQELLEQSKKGTLGQQGEAELERHLTLEHLVRLAKAHAYRRLHSDS